MGIEKITQVFKDQDKKAAFMPYVVAGFPDVENCVQIIQGLVEAGADLIELGVPFSDPIADGPVIQSAGQKALLNGVTVKGCLGIAARVREEGIDIPIILMSYLNPLIAYGLDKLVEDAAAAGVDGFIVPDLPPEEGAGFEAACRQNGLALIYLLSPASSAERIELVAAHASGFVYLVSLTGVTGTRDSLSAGLAGFISRGRKATDLPLAVGFGISNKNQAAAVAEMADGVVVGSALVSAANESTAAVFTLAEEIVAGIE